MRHNKRFIVIGNINAITLRDIFPLIKNNQVWYGYSNTNGNVWFQVPDGRPFEKISQDGEKLKSLRNIRWFTNLDHKKRQDKMVLWAKFCSDKYPKYDNFDAIEVSKKNEIPKDYFGVMGVPITFINDYNPEQFEIIDLVTPSLISSSGDVEVKYKRLLIRRK